MGRVLDISNSIHGQPFGADANSWMQQAYFEQSAAAVIAWIGPNYDPATVYILYGCELTSGGGITSVAAGWVFSNGVFYEMNAASYADPSGGDVNIVNAYVVNGDGMGTLFADGFIANAQIDTGMKCAAGPSGSGTIGNYVDLQRLQKWVDITLENSWINTGPPYGGPAQCMLDNENNLHLRGAIRLSDTSDGNGQRITSLPLITPIIWPAQNRFVSAVTRNANYGIATIMIEITNSGFIVPFDTVSDAGALLLLNGVNDIVSLDGIIIPLSA